jgi:hypothetical protein
MPVHWAHPSLGLGFSTHTMRRPLPVLWHEAAYEGVKGNVRALGDRRRSLLFFFLSSPTPRVAFFLFFCRGWKDFICRKEKRKTA